MNAARWRGGLPWWLVVAALIPQLALGQQVTMEGRGDYANDQFLKHLLARPQLHVLSTDTLIGPNDTVPGPVLVVGSTVRVEGVIGGDLVIVDANVFLRPPARVLGDVTNLAGGYFPAPGATVGGGVRDEPNAPYDAVWRDGRVRIVGTRHASAFLPQGFRGILLPTYDRVDGLSAGLGGGYLTPRLGRLAPFVRGRVRYRSQRGALTGAGEAGLEWTPNTRLIIGAERTTATPDEWLRSDLHNSLSYLYDGTDYRNYYQTDRIYGRWDLDRRTESEELHASIGAHQERDQSLPAGHPWTGFSTDSIRPNPSVADARITSVTASLRGNWRASHWVGSSGGELEWAVTALAGDYRFARFAVWSDWALPAFGRQSVHLRWRFQGPLPGTDSLPRQRWTFVGGDGTLETEPIAAFRGDRLAYVETGYIIPFPDAVDLPLLGHPDLELIHRAAMAWSVGARRALEQNVGIRLRFPLLNARFFFDPHDPSGRYEFTVGVNGPRRSYPWESPGLGN